MSKKFTKRVLNLCKLSKPFKGEEWAQVDCPRPMDVRSRHCLDPFFDLIQKNLSDYRNPKRVNLYL